MTATANIVWNRACYGGGEVPRLGDKHLSALLHFHGAAMNGGVMHAIEYCSPQELMVAKAGYVYLGAAEVIPLLARAEAVLQNKEDSGSFEREVDSEYGNLAKDSRLSALFQAKYEQEPGDFAPVQ